MKGKKKVEEIKQRLSELLKRVSPESAEKYEIRYKPIETYYHGTTGAEVPVSYRDSPAYELDLVSKKDPKNFYEIMHVFWPDIRGKIPPHMEKYYGSSVYTERVKEGIEKLKKKAKKRLK